MTATNTNSHGKQSSTTLLLGALLLFGSGVALQADLAANNLKTPKLIPASATLYGQTYTEWFNTYWRWYLGGADPAQSTVGPVQLLPLPNGEFISGTGTPEDPSLFRGHLELTLPRATPFVLPAFALYGERYNNGSPDDQPLDNAVVLAGAHPTLTIDGVTVLSDANKADYYVGPSYFEPPLFYPAPTDYGSIAAIFFQGAGIIAAPLKPGTHVIHIYEPFILEGIFAVIYENTWTITVGH